MQMIGDSLSRVCYLIILIFILPVVSQSYTIQGNVAVNDVIKVKYAIVTFINQKDTTQKYSAITDTSGNYLLDVMTGIDHIDYNLPSRIELAQNYPNPFIGTTIISYQLNQPVEVRIKIFNLLGQEVRELKTGKQTAGIYGYIWDGMNKYGKKVSPGIYFYQLKAGSEIFVKKMLYGFGKTADGYGTKDFTSSGIAQLGKEILNKTNNTVVANGVFAIHVTNTDSTEPKIITKELEGFTIQGDTTINLILEKVKDEILYIKYDINENWAELYVMDIDGTYHKMITDSVLSFGIARWSPNGRWIAYEGPYDYYENYQIYIVKDDGTGKRLVTLWERQGMIEPHPDGGSHPVWSPDGKKIAFSRCVNCELGGNNIEIFIIDIDTTGGVKETRLTNNFFPDGVFDWSPDGETVLFGSIDSVGHWYTSTMKPDGTCKQRVFIDVFMTDMRFSHSGDRVAFYGSMDGNFGLYIMNRDGTNAQKILESVTPYSDYPISWSPDDTRLLLGKTCISADGSGFKDLPILGEYIYSTDWRPIIE